MKIENLQITENEQKVCVKCPQDLLPTLNLFYKQYQNEQREIFTLITINAKHEILSVRFIGAGTTNSCIISKTEIFRKIFEDRKTTAFFVCHNHPSNFTEPSTYDIEMTLTLITASKILGIELLDHIIYGSYNYYSFLENGLFKDLEEKADKLIEKM